MKSLDIQGFGSTTQGQEGNPTYVQNNLNQPGGDPEMIYLSPVEQTINNITLYSATQSSNKSCLVFALKQTIHTHTHFMCIFTRGDTEPTEMVG